jgi:hypothetical protein
VISYSKKVTLRDCGLIEACRKRFYPGGFNWEKNVGGDASHIYINNEERRNKK